MIVLPVLPAAIRVLVTVQQALIEPLHNGTDLDISITAVVKPGAFVMIWYSNPSAEQHRMLQLVTHDCPSASRDHSTALSVARQANTAEII